MLPDLPKGPALVTAAVIATGLDLTPAHAGPVDAASTSCPDPGPAKRNDSLQVVGWAHGLDGTETRQRAQIDAMTRLLARLSENLSPRARLSIETADPEALLRDHPDWLPMTLVARDYRGDEQVAAECYVVRRSDFGALVARHQDMEPLTDIEPEATAAGRFWPVVVGHGAPGGVVVIHAGAEGIQVGDRVVAVDGTPIETLDAFRAAARAAIARDPDRLVLRIQRGAASPTVTLRSMSLLPKPLEERLDLAPTCGPCCHGAGWPECGPGAPLPSGPSVPDVP